MDEVYGLLLNARERGWLEFKSQLNARLALCSVR